MLIIYRQTTGEVVENTGTNSYLPEGPDDDLAWGGRTEEDRTGLALLRLHDDDDAELVQATFTHHVTVRETDGEPELVIGDPLEAPTPEDPALGEPTVAELQQQVREMQDVLDAVTQMIAESGTTV